MMSNIDNLILCRQYDRWRTRQKQNADQGLSEGQLFSLPLLHGAHTSKSALYDTTDSHYSYC